MIWLAAIYILLLICSGVYRARLTPTELPIYKKAILTQAINGKYKTGNKIRIAYKDSGEADSNRMPIVLVHGSPGSLEAFDNLSKHLKNRRIISVDLPGFGHSEELIPDYSIYAHSKYLGALMSELKIEKAHFLGFSLGGGVILHLADEMPDKVESISFIASIGVQEYELLGNYWANHIVHGVQFGFFWTLKELTPHFGILDGMMLSYARNFYDTDQRPLRALLEKIDKPFLILHGKEDPLVPVEAAREHARLVPQSEYHELDDNHFFVFMRPEKIEKILEDFWSRAERGLGTTRVTADKTRIAESAKPFEPKILKAKGATVFVFLLLILFVVFINEDAAFLLIGFLSGQGWFGLEFGLVAGFAGVLLAVFLMLLVGRLLKKRNFQTSNLATISWPKFVRRIIKHKFFRFRFLEYLLAGKEAGSFWNNLLFFVASALPWALILTSAAYFATQLFY